MITAASSWWYWAMSASVVARSLYGAIRTSPSIACGIPAESGIGAGKALGERGLTLMRP